MRGVIIDLRTWKVQLSKASFHNPFSKIVQNSVQHQAAESRSGSEEENQEPGKACKKSALPLGAVWCNPLQNSQMPPLGLEESPKSSGNTGVSENHCADPCAQFSNSEQLAAIISAMDRNELEQRLLDLLKEIQPDTSE